MRKIIIINAKNKTLGKLMNLLININKNNIFNKYKYKIIIMNTNYIKYTGKKIENKIYYKHTGYPGGLKKKSLKELIKKNFFMKKSIKNIFPKNKFSNILIKKIKIINNFSKIFNFNKPKILINDKMNT